MKYSISASFLAPTLGLKDNAPLNIYGAYYIDTYSADALNPKYTKWGTHLLLHYTQDLPEKLREYFQSLPSFVETYEPEKGESMFVFVLDENLRESYIEPVLQGRYSQADKQVVDLYFPNKQFDPRYGNRLVFEKSNLWRNHWEEQLGISLPPGAEVWPKAQHKRETHGFIDPAELGLEPPADQMKVNV